MDQIAVPYAPDREWFTLAITVTPAAPAKPKTEPSKKMPDRNREPTEIDPAASTSAAPAEKAKLEPPAPPSPPKTFYFTFVVFPAGDYDIGSVNDEPDRLKSEVRHTSR